MSETIYFDEDIKTKQCVICTWEYPVALLEHGVCPHCKEEYELEPEFQPRRKCFDDEE